MSKAEATKKDDDKKETKKVEPKKEAASAKKDDDKKASPKKVEKDENKEESPKKDGKKADDNESKEVIGDKIDLTKQVKVVLNETLAKNEFPEKELKECNSLMKKYCTKKLFNEYKKLKTKNGFTFAQCVNTGVKNPRSLMGCHAGDIESYTLFGKFFNSVINDYHNTDISKKSQPNEKMDSDKLKYKLSDTAKKAIISTRIRVARNLDGFNLAPGQSTLAEKKKIEKVFIDIFNEINTGKNNEYKDFKGKYYPLYEISEEQRQQFIKDHFLFKGNDKMQADSGYHLWFPQARGIYFNNDKTFLCWINEGDHLRIISMEKSGDVKSVYNRLAKAANLMESIMVKKKICKGFMKTKVLGNITCCPTNLGTGLRGGVHIKLPKLAKKSIKDLNKISIKYHCQIRGIHGEHSESKGGIMDISNKYRFGYSENELVSFMVNGVNKLVALEATEK